MISDGDKMALRFPKQKRFVIFLARNTRTGTVKWDWEVDESLLIRLRQSGEWMLTGVKEDDGFRQDTLEVATTQ